jgi:hypothetical protein
MIPDDIDKIQSVDQLKQVIKAVLMAIRTGISTQTFIDAYERMQPLQNWFFQSKCIIKEYYKSVGLKHNQLGLVDSALIQKPLEKLNIFRVGLEDQTQEDVKMDDGE